MQNLKDYILAVDDTSGYQPVDVAEWPETKGKLAVRNLTELEYEQTKPDLPGFKARLAVAVLVDWDTKKPIFKPEEAVKLGAKNCNAIARISNAWFAWQRRLDEAVEAKND